MKKWILTVIVVGVMIALAQKMKGAVTVTTITSSQFNTLISSYNAAWSAVFTGGGISGYASEEIRLARNTATPQVGGGSGTLIGNLTWSASNNDLEISIDGAGNISARANSATVGTLSIVRPFNQILIFLYDESLFDSASSTGTDVNSNSVRNMFADGFGFPGQSDIISISGFGSQAPFVLNSVWNPGIAPVTDQQYMWVVGIQNTSIPEPSSMALMGVTFPAMLRRRR